MNQFIANYLLHMEEEEKIQRDFLWETYSDAELEQVIVAFDAHRTAEQKAADYAFVLPVL